jgi:twitching motility protein PilT
MTVLEELLKQMVRAKASDLLLTAGAPPQFRINGMLEPFGEAPLVPTALQAIADGVLDERQRELLCRHRSIDLSRGFEGLARFRFNFYYQRDSVAAAIRIIPFEIPSFEALGLPPLLREYAGRPHGLVLITGPAGSGKSTTLAAMIDYINHRRRLHVVCIEDPVEYLHKHRLSTIDQREIGSDADSFAGAMRSVFRQSPDVIMVGEMRDLETMQLALSLAETGHLILATLHTQDTTHAINRIVDVFPPAQQQHIYTQLSLVLVGIVSQQLVPLRGGGRVLACEILNANHAVRNLIREGQVQQLYSVVQTGRADGMVTMNDTLYGLCADGGVDPEMALSRSPRPKELARLFETKPRMEGRTA